MSTMSANQAHLLELQVAMQECYLNGDNAGLGSLQMTDILIVIGAIATLLTMRAYFKGWNWEEV